jgi:hypothetical protein
MKDTILLVDITFKVDNPWVIAAACSLPLVVLIYKEIFFLNWFNWLEIVDHISFMVF